MEITKIYVNCSVSSVKFKCVFVWLKAAHTWTREMKLCQLDRFECEMAKKENILKNGKQKQPQNDDYPRLIHVESFYVINNNRV